MKKCHAGDTLCQLCAPLTVVVAGSALSPYPVRTSILAHQGDHAKKFLRLSWRYRKDRYVKRRPCRLLCYCVNSSRLPYDIGWEATVIGMMTT